MFRILVCCLAALTLVTLVTAEEVESDEHSEYKFKLGRTDNDAKWRGRLEINKDGGEWGSVCYDKGG